MKRTFLILLSLFFAGFSFSQNEKTQVSYDVIYPTEFHITKPLREIVKEHPFVEQEKEEKESVDRSYRTPQTFLFTAADGPQYGDDPAVRQTVMGTRLANQTKAPIVNWAGQVATGFRPMDPTGAAGPNHYVQAINGTPFRVHNKTTGANLLTANIGSLWSPATPNDGDPIIMYDKYADRWFVSQFGTSGNKMYIAISTTNDPTGSYYTYTYTSPQFPDYLKFSIWENGYYMTSNQTTDKVFCFERDQMLLGNPSARSISANFTTGSVSGFFVPLPADASDGGLPPAGTPLPFFCYTENSWGGGNIDGVKIWNMTVNWGTTPSASITLNTTVACSAFDGTYDPSWNDIIQPGTSQKLDGIGGVPTYRAQWRPWAGYNTVVLNWGVLLSASQRSIRWVELRQNQTTGVWSLYQESTYAPDAHSRWVGSIAMDDNGSIGLAYAKSSSTVYPSLCYTGRLASDPLGTMSFAETVAIAGTSFQTGTNRFGDYSHTSLDPDGITFWHTGEYISGGVKTRIFSFQLPVLNPIAGVAIAVTSGTNPGCAGSSVTFTATPTNGGSNPSYQWKVNGTNVGTNSPTYTTSTLTNGQIVTCVMTSNLSGVTGNPATSNSITMTINAIPVTPAASSNTPVCAGNSINLTTPTATGATYSWTGPNSFTSTTQNPTITNATTAMAGSYSVAITQNGCTSLPGSTTVVVNSGPATPTASSNSPVCVGSTINLTTPTVGGGTYNWTGPNGFTSTQQNPTITGATAIMAGTYTVSVTQGGCPSLGGTTTVTIDSTPVVDFSATPTTTTCSGLVQFTDATTGNPNSWLWNFGDGQTSTQQNPTCNYLASGTYTVTLTATNTCGNNQLVKTNYVTINVPTAPTVTNGSRCGTGTVNLSATGSGILHWFDAPTGGTDLGTGTNFTTPSISATTTFYVEDQMAQTSQYVGPLTTFAAGAYSNTAYTLNFDCLSPCTLVSVAVGKQIAGNVTIQLTTSTGTVLQSGTFAVPAGNSRVTLNWPLTVGTGLKLVGQANVGLWRVNSSGTFPYTLTGLISITSCSSTIRYGSFFDWEIKEPNCSSSRVPVVATINTTSPASLSIAANNSTICNGASVTFTASPTNGGNTPTYQWQINGSNVGTNSATFTSSTLANNDVVTCQMTSSSTCASPATATSNSITMSVNANVTPSVSISASAATICSGTSVTFTATPTNGGTPSYQWKLNGANVGSNGPTYTNNTLSNGNTVSCVMTSTASCVSPATANSNSITMTVNSNVIPSVAINASSTTICSGTTVTFTATPTNGGTPTYQWKRNGTNVGTNSATYTNNALVNGDIITCVMTSTAACASPSTANSNSITMTVSSPVTPSVSITANSLTICSGQTVNFSATPTNGGTNPIYQWQLNGSNVGTNSTTYSNSTLNNNDNITCTITSNAACVSPSTATSNTVTITVTSSAIPSISISSSSTSICSGTTVNFTAIPTNEGPTPTYQWTLNGSNVGTNSPTYSNSTLTNNDVINCNLISSLGCANPTNASSNTITISVLPTVVPSVSISASATSICSGNSVIFTATPINGGTPSYQWTLNGSNVGTNSPTYTNSTLTNNDIVACNMISTLNCVSQSNVASNNITMIVNNNVTPLIVIASSSNNICSGQTVSFNATSANGGIATYQWTVNGSNVGTNSSSYSSSALNDGDVITCALTSSDPCASPSTVTSNTITMAVAASTTPTITIAASSSNVCQGDLVTFTATASGEGSNPIYQWEINGINVGTNSNTYSSTSINSNDNITCTLISSESCTVINNIVSNIINIQVSGIPVASFNYSFNQLDYIFTNTSTGATNYFWDFGDGNTSTLSNPAHTYLTGGLYLITLTAYNDCDTNQIIQSINVVESDVAGINNSFSVGIYPNPTTNLAIVEINGIESNDSEIIINDEIGRTLYNYQFVNLNGNTKLNINMSQYAKCIYFFKLRIGENNQTFKVIKN